eukprot:Protomagalhaensia_wolfi_Nauph_80__1656@NODE_2023_length_1241_cov_35_633111_g1583_i0_p1_GENE_NODE_2023_length_1241_cov_35_633111_g1583_i0NODE_2023_length_1241_cov_35_633111_g1583_i0_p1_ORF_typecomplete_len201_score41_29FeS_assembly_P/PF01883_19/1_8e18PanZ/PF12568_8/0_17_NODE_2023_length_1241_cov_35_633111_g1583_i05611163
MENPEPTVFQKTSHTRDKKPTILDLHQTRVAERIDEQEVFEWLKNLKDPEYPLSLEELKVVYVEGINVDLEKRLVSVEFTPTVPHCSQATLIGLMIRCVLQWSLPSTWKTRVYIKEGSHSTEESINKQLADKERVAAALENPRVLAMIVRGVLRIRSIDEVMRTSLQLEGQSKASSLSGGASARFPSRPCKVGSSGFSPF